MELDIQIIENPDKSLVDFFSRQLEIFNTERWEVKQKFPLAICVSDSDDRVVAGAAARTFGLWLLIDNLWVSAELRGQNMGTKVLYALERAAQGRGCQFSLLDTLNFQARPFYEKQGYKLQWTQNNYPKDGCKYFMTKQLGGNPST
jgi:GNAT superfamily N-acetyltransferase